MVRLEDLLTSLSAAGLRAQTHGDAAADRIATELAGLPGIDADKAARFTIEKLELTITAAASPLHTPSLTPDPGLLAAIAGAMNRLARTLPEHPVLGNLFRGDRRLIREWDRYIPSLENALALRLKTPPLDWGVFAGQAAELFFKPHESLPLWRRVLALTGIQPRLAPKAEHHQALTHAIRTIIDEAFLDMTLTRQTRNGRIQGTIPAIGLFAVPAGQFLPASAHVTLTVIAALGQPVTAHIVRAEMSPPRQSTRS